MVLFRAREQPTLCETDPNLGWTGLAAGGLHVDEVPGGHSAILREPDVRDLALRLLDYRDRALHAGD